MARLSALAWPLTAGRCALPLLLVLLTRAGASETVTVAVVAPLTTIVYAHQALGDQSRLGIDVDLPADAPGGLAGSIFVVDDTGQWYQSPVRSALAPGATTHLLADLGVAALWRSEPSITDLSPARRALLRRFGVFIWGEHAVPAVVTVHILQVEEVPSGPPSPLLDQSAGSGVLRDLVVDGADAGGVVHGQTGTRWSLQLRPAPFPDNPYDPQLFSLDLAVNGPDGFYALIPGFYDLPMALADRGDCEDSQVAGPDRFMVRFRPRLPGTYRLTLQARWHQGAVRSVHLPDLVVAGDAWDEYVHVDPVDHRFFSVGTHLPRFIWPIGLNLASPCDQLTESDPSKRAYGTTPTPDRGTFAYDAFLARLAAAGGTAAEIWMSSWNLGLEWNGKWRGYHNLGRYNERNAARLDRLLDLSWAHGVRLVVNLNNHGQYLANSGESEWLTNPYNRINGGPLTIPDEVFTDPAAITAQDNLRRYIAARYADHPAVLVWKLFSEVDLTQLGIKAIRAGQGGMEELRAWHEHAADQWHHLDTYGHPVGTHVATTYQNADPRLFSSPFLDAIGLDSYYAPNVYTHASNLSGLMVDAMLDPERGVLVLHKPVFVTEYGGGFHNMNHDELGVEHRTGAWLALVTGEATSPMLWMHEWVDQNNQWRPYGAIGRFIAGEDLRGAQAATVTLSASDPLWAQAWERPGLVLAYIQDQRWAHAYAPQGPVAGGLLTIGEAVPAGTLAYEWWDCDGGVVRSRGLLRHGGGALRLVVPTFHEHIALKLRRTR